MAEQQERYRMTEHGIAIHERYTVTLLSAEEAVRMTNWLLVHYGQLHKMAGEQAKREKEREEK